MKEIGEMINFAELLWCVIKIPDFLKEHQYSWTSSRASSGFFVLAGDFDGDGGIVNSYRPWYSNPIFGCAFSAVTLKGNEASNLEARVKALEDWASKEANFINPFPRK